MKGYKVFTKDMAGYEGACTVYTTKYEIAVRNFNKKLQKVIGEYDVITDKNDFGCIKTEFKEPELIPDEEPKEIICMKAPYIIYKKGNVLLAAVFYDYNCGYEHDEHDIGAIMVIVEEIEILE